MKVFVEEHGHCHIAETHTLIQAMKHADDVKKDHPELKVGALADPQGVMRSTTSDKPQCACTTSPQETIGQAEHRMPMHWMPGHTSPEHNEVDQGAKEVAQRSKMTSNNLKRAKRMECKVACEIVHEHFLKEAQARWKRRQKWTPKEIITRPHKKQTRSHDETRTAEVLELRRVHG